ncbi:PAS domain S-box protein [bacterium]|nr:PAS domain S-box protein [bacterium]
MDKKKVLFIDDDKKFREIAESAFKNNKDYDCYLCESGKEGLGKIGKISPNIVIVDYFLPDISGEELYIKFIADKKNKFIRDIPFIALTTNGQADRSHLYNLGFNAILAKPFTSSEIIEFVEDALIAHKVKMEEIQFWETIREAKDFLERVVENTLDAILTTDNKGVITYCNSACEEMLGFTFEEVIGEKVNFLFVNGSEEMLKIYELLKKSNQITNYNARVKDKKGDIFNLNLSVCRMKNSSNQIVGSLVIARKSDPGNNINIELNDSERVATIIETAIAVNHAINNPLVPILGNAQILLQDKKIVDEDIRNRLRIIVKNALRIKEITQKLAHISHPVTVEYFKGTKMLDIEHSL